MEIIVLLMLILGMGGIFVLVFNSGKKKSIKSTKDNKKVTSKQINVETKKDINGIKKANSDVSKKDMFEFMEFEKIADDMIIQDKETKFSMVLQCKGINYDLMSEIEQLAIEEGFINFLNTLKSPIQLYVQARAVDLRTSLNMYKEKVQEINQEYNNKNDEYKRIVNDINSTDKEKKDAEYEKEKLANITEYASDITRYVERLSLNKHMLQRKFYVIISYYKGEISSTANFSKNEIYEICRRELYTRAQSLVSSLQSCSVSANIMSSNEIAELLYISYNRDDEKLMDIKTALDSGFYRMYTTSKDVQEKKDELLREKIKEEAMKRIEIAIQKGIEEGTLKSKEQFIEDYEESVDIEAINILEQSDLDEKQKKKIQQRIVDEHNLEAEKRDEERKKIINEKKVEVKDEDDENKDIKNSESNSSDSETDMIV